MADNPYLPTFEESLRIVADLDVQGLIRAREAYGNSWRKEGGVGAFFTFSRKWDRLYTQIKKAFTKVNPKTSEEIIVGQYDVFAHCVHNMEGEGFIDQVRDLRRYLLLVEAYLVETGADLPVQRDNK